MRFGPKKTASLGPEMQMQAMNTDMPRIGDAFRGFVYADISTGRDGVPYALLVPPIRPNGKLTWQAAGDWARAAGVELPTRLEAAVLFSNVPSTIPDVFWINEEWDARRAWYCLACDGYQDSARKEVLHGVTPVVRMPVESFKVAPPHTPRTTRRQIAAVEELAEVL